jgi:hypothetical protein
LGPGIRGIENKAGQTQGNIMAIKGIEKPVAANNNPGERN